MILPKITVITPTLNTGESIETALLSVASQTYANIEHIIVDGASKDKTLPTIRKYQKTYKNIRLLTEKDTGIYNAMNKGLDLCTGDWIIFMGADDLFYNENVLTDLFEHGLFQEEQIIYGNVSVVGDTAWAKNGSIYDGPFDLKKILRRNICHQGILYPRSVIKQIGYYSEKYLICSDWDYNLRCFTKYKFTFTDKIIAFFKTGGASLGNDEAFVKDHLNNIINYFQVDPHANIVHDPESPFYYPMACYRENEYISNIQELKKETEKLNQHIADQQTEYIAMRSEFEGTFLNFKAEHENILTSLKEEHDENIRNLIHEHDLFVSTLKSGYEETIQSLQEERQAFRELFRQKEAEFNKVIESKNQLIEHLTDTIAAKELHFREAVEKYNTEAANLQGELTFKNHQIATIYNSYIWKTGRFLLGPAIFIARKIKGR